MVRMRLAVPSSSPKPRCSSSKLVSSSRSKPKRRGVRHALLVAGTGQVVRPGSDMTYDGLGRLTNVWIPGRDRATQTPSTKFTYQVRKSGGPSAVTTTTGYGGDRVHTTPPLGGTAATTTITDAHGRTVPCASTRTAPTSATTLPHSTRPPTPTLCWGSSRPSLTSPGQTSGRTATTCAAARRAPLTRTRAPPTPPTTPPATSKPPPAPWAPARPPSRTRTTSSAQVRASVNLQGCEDRFRAQVRPDGKC